MCALRPQVVEGTGDVVGTCLALGLGSEGCESGDEKDGEDG